MLLCELPGALLEKRKLFVRIPRFKVEIRDDLEIVNYPKALKAEIGKKPEIGGQKSEIREQIFTKQKNNVKRQSVERKETGSQGLNRVTEKCFEQKSVKGIAKSLSVKTLDTARCVADLIVRQLAMHGQHEDFLKHLFRSRKV